MPHALDPAVVEHVRRLAFGASGADGLRKTLDEFIGVGTCVSKGNMTEAAREQRMFDLIESGARAADADVVCRRAPIDPSVAQHGDGGAMPDDEALAGRGSLVVESPGGDSQLRPLICSVPVGAASAQLAVLLVQMRLLRELRQEFGIAPARSVAYHFVIGGSSGAGGPLALARDSRVTGEAVLVAEPTNLRPYCGHVGCVQYRLKLNTADAKSLSAVEMFPLAVVAMENELRRIRAESSVEMFPPSHARINHGVLDHFGRAGDRVCNHVAFEISARAGVNAERIAMLMTEYLDEAVAEYVKLYGDATQRTDPATGTSALERHFGVNVTAGAEFHTIRLHMYGIGGHMITAKRMISDDDTGAFGHRSMAGHMGVGGYVNALQSPDSAITKAAYLLATLLYIGRRFPMVRAFARLADDTPAGGSMPGRDEQSAEGGHGQAQRRRAHNAKRVPSEITLCGAATFSPSHGVDDIKARLMAAAVRGVQKFCQMRRIPYSDAMVTMDFDLAYDACTQSPDSPPMQALRAAFDALSEPWPEPVAYPTTSDARHYVEQGMPTAIFGPGLLDEQAHGMADHVNIADLQKALAISALATWAMIR